MSKLIYSEPVEPEVVGIQLDLTVDECDVIYSLLGNMGGPSGCPSDTAYKKIFDLVKDTRIFSSQYAGSYKVVDGRAVRR